MAIQYPTFQNTLTKADLGIPDYASALNKGLNLFQNTMKSAYTPRNLENEAVSQEYANMIKQPYAENAGRAFEADMGGQEATAGLTNQNMLKQKILNEFLREREPAEIAEIRARERYYGSGGSAGGVGAKDYQNYLNGIMQDNPGLKPEQYQEAADVLAKGGTKLSDGTPLKPMSFGTKSAFDRTVKATTTASQVNTLNSANQADAELDVFTKLANTMRKPYGTTYFGKSPEQIADSFKKDDASQTRLGKLIAANALEFDIAQARNRIAGGAPGITSTNQMMDEAKQHIALYGPRLSGKAREVANDELNKALRAGLAARNKGGFGAGNLYQRQYTANVTPEQAQKAENPEDKKEIDNYLNQVSVKLLPTIPDATPANIKRTAKEVYGEVNAINIDKVMMRLMEREEKKRRANNG